MKNDTGVLCSLMIRRNMASSKKEATTLLKGEALLRATNYMVNASVRIKKR